MRNLTLKKQTKRSAVKAVLALSATLLISACIPDFGGEPEVEDDFAGPTVDLSAPVKVALLAPNGGGNATLNDIGTALANSGQIAARDYNKGEIELKVYATGGDYTRAVSAAQEAKAEGAKLIIGPLTSVEAAAVSNAVNLPILSFSNNSEIAEGNTFILGTTFQSIADRVIDYQKSNGGNALGIVYQNDVGGQTGAKSTNAAASDKGVSVVANEPYKLSQADIEAAAPGIAGRLKSSGANMVMLTDNPAGGLRYIASGLRDNGFTNQDATFLGLSLWNENAADLAAAGLVGGIFAVPDPARTANFNTLYQAQYGSAPHNLAGLGFDGVIAAIALVRQARKKNDDTPFSTSDINRVKFGGANGAVRFNGHTAQRGLAVMQLQNGATAVVSSAPDSF